MALTCQAVLFQVEALGKRYRGTTWAARAAAAGAMKVRAIPVRPTTTKIGKKSERPMEMRQVEAEEEQDQGPGHEQHRK